MDKAFPDRMRKCANDLRAGKADAIAGVPLALEVSADEIERLEKERFKFESALLLIGLGYPGAVELANAAIGKSETV